LCALQTGGGFFNQSLGFASERFSVVMDMVSKLAGLPGSHSRPQVALEKSCFWFGESPCCRNGQPHVCLGECNIASWLHAQSVQQRRPVDCSLFQSSQTDAPGEPCRQGGQSKLQANIV